MAGHSKFKNIMHRKGRQDAARARVFTRLTREIIVAARSSPDPAMNPRLRAAVIAARKENMPNDKIDNAIKRGSGEIEGEALEEIRYEGYGPNGVAIIIEAMTDNRNRTAAEIRSIFSKNGGNMGETGSVEFMFARKGVITYPRSVAGDEAMFEAALDAGADNVESDEDGHEVTCAMEDFAAVRDALQEKFGDAQSAKLQFIATTTAPLGAEASESLLKLLEAFDDNDDVQEVYSNAELDATVMERMNAA